MISHIMLPLDGSELAERAQPVAERVAMAVGADLHVVRVVEPAALIVPMPVAATAQGMPPPVAYMPQVSEEWEASIQAAADYLASRRRRLTLPMGDRVKTDRLMGNVAAELLDYVSANDIDLIVMCSHGRSGLSRFALGSIADRLLRDGTAPVLLVRAFGDQVQLEQAVVCLDGSSRAETALEMVTALAPAVIREVTLLRVAATPKEGMEAERYLEATARRLPQDRLTYQVRVERGEAAQRILEVAQSKRLVVLVTHGRSGLMRWAMGSVADHVAHGSPAGLLLLRTGTMAQPERPQE
jgi:nucleotide-binding universal stress UspA family protein